MRVKQSPQVASAGPMACEETGFSNIAAGNYEKFACGVFLITGFSISVHNVSGLWFDMFHGRVLSGSSILSVSQVIDTFREMIRFI